MLGKDKTENFSSHKLRLIWTFWGSMICGGCKQLSPITGASMNLARSLGPAIVHNEYKGIWIYLVSPTLGAVAGDRGASHVELHWSARLKIV
ncbi:hypothetical protein JHK86_033874 [Glycine max]|nr:hypothetical protein JHK86_033874 [Glycine max]